MSPVRKTSPNKQKAELIRISSGNKTKDKLKSKTREYKIEPFDLKAEMAKLHDEQVLFGDIRDTKSELLKAKLQKVHQKVMSNIATVS